MDAVQRDDGSYAGITTIGSWKFDTTGVLGLSRDASGELDARGFPSWITLPSYRDLATGRRWHFFFAWLFVLNGLAYLIYAAWSGHVRRDLAPTRSQLRHIGQSVWEHIRFHFPKGEEAKSYNVLQKLTYLAVIFGLLPLIFSHRSHHVAGNERGVPVSARRLRRAAVGPHHPLLVRHRHHAVRHRARIHGALPRAPGTTSAR